MNNKHLPAQEGSIEVICGPMFAGKSSELMKKVRNYTYKQKRVCVINYALDTRYTDKDEISTHDK